MVLDEREPTPGSLKNFLPKTFVAKSIACGGWHTLIMGDFAESNKRAVYVWGNGAHGQLGLQRPRLLGIASREKQEPIGNHQFPTELKQFTLPVDNPGHIVMIAAGANQSAALTKDGRIFSWGQGTSEIPTVEFKDLQKMQAVACGTFHTLALSVEGDVYSWGSGRVNSDVPLHSQLDPYFLLPTESSAPPSEFKATKIPIPEGKKVVAIAAANDTSVALTGWLFLFIFFLYTISI